MEEFDPRLGKQQEHRVRVEYEEGIEEEQEQEDEKSWESKIEQGKDYHFGFTIKLRNPDPFDTENDTSFKRRFVFEVIHKFLRKLTKWV